jgi:hypothetical protein
VLPIEIVDPAAPEVLTGVRADCKLKPLAAGPLLRLRRQPAARVAESVAGVAPWHPRVDLAARFESGGAELFGITKGIWADADHRDRIAPRAPGGDTVGLPNPPLQRAWSSLTLEATCRSTYLPVGEVSEIAEILRGIEVSRLMSTLPSDMGATFFGTAELPDDPETYYKEHFMKLRTFVEEAARRRLALVMWWD